MDPLRAIADHPALRRLADALAPRRHAVASGSHGSSTHLLAAALAQRLGRCVVLVLAHLDEGDEALDELASLAPGLRTARLPGLEVLAGETGVSAELLAERLAAVRTLLSWRDAPPGPAVLIAPVQALMQPVPPESGLAALSLTLARGATHKLPDLVRWLDRAGYKRLEAADEPGDFALRGGILDVFPAGGHASAAGGERVTLSGPVRLDFFGDQIDRLAEVDPETMGSGRELESVELIAAPTDAAGGGAGQTSALNLLPEGAVAVIAETIEVTEQARGYFERVTADTGVFGPPAVFKALKDKTAALAEINQFSAGATQADTRVELPFALLPGFAQDAGEAVKDLAQRAGEHEVVVCCQNPAELQRFQELLAEAAPDAAPRIESRVAYVHRGFVIERPQGALALVPYHELLHRYHTRRRAVRLRAGRAMDTFLDIQPGDYVVHAEHGVARYLGLKSMRPPRTRQGPAGGTDPSLIPAGLRDALGPEARAEAQEYLTLEFAGGTKLHVPATGIDLVQRYVGGFKGKPPLSTLGGQRWKSQKQRVAESVKDLAAEMLRVRAAREHMPGISYPPDTKWQREFEAEFPYEETEDQLAALVEIKKDMQAARPMDRLVCGDVGFGKTELAIRAAFKAAESGRQVAVLVPTTVLAEQHERTFRGRFADYPFKIESLSRFKSGADEKRILEAVRKGHVDVLIGTHRILSEDVRFADLGLVVIDEEQRFGVEHKERLLRLRLTVDVLTLSATPIPRTLHMAMLGLRDISSLTTAPLDRRAIVTEVIPFNPRRVQQAIARELAREGQVYFVHNRVHDILSAADDVRRLSPEGTRIVVGHGQMNPHELEEVMLRFMRRDADILVSTTIIESGIDNPHANTMIINDADRFGLADLHQLRGRVGRSKHRAYCYLLLDPEKSHREIAQKRLKAIEQYSMLGAGFKIAMRDLEIRGAGNLLGAEQSGHIAAVGYEMYCRLLDDAVRGLRNEAPPITASATGVDIGVSGTIPKSYIPSDPRRLEAYRRAATAASPEDLAKVAADLAAAYGEPPPPVRRLLDLAELKVAAARLGVRAIALRGPDVLLRTEDPIATARRFDPAFTAIDATGALHRSPRVPSERAAPRPEALSPEPEPAPEPAPITPPSSLIGLRPATTRRAASPRPPAPGALKPTRAAPPPPPPPPAKPAPREGVAAGPALAVRVLPPPAGEKLHEVYVRVPEAYLEPDSLLLMLRRRLAPAQAVAGR